MRCEPYVGRVGGLAVALGVGAAVFTGWAGGGVAWADESGQPPASTTTSSTASGAARGDTGSVAKRRSAKPHHSAVTAPPKTTGTVLPTSSHTASARSGSNLTATKPSTVRLPAAEIDSAVLGIVTHPRGAVDAQPAAPATISSTVSAASTVKSVVTAVFSGMAKAVLGPLTANTGPSGQTDTPAIWSLLAFARREFGSTVQSPAPTTAAAADVPTAQNSLSYTGPPNIIDRLTTLGLQLMGKLGDITGINFTGLIGTLESTGVPPIFLTFGLHTQQTEYEVAPGNVWKVWEFTPANPTGKTVIALHGGGFILQAGILNWIDYTDMARNTGATVIVPIYPLATTAKGSLLNVDPEMADFISHEIDLHGAANVSLYADSAGCTYAMAALREIILRGDPVPASMVLISPSADDSLTNPDIKSIDDPFFDVNNLSFWKTGSHAFDGITDLKDPRVSPLYMETDVLQAMPPTTIYIGSDEMLEPDNLLLYQRATKIGAPISMVVGVGMVHDWPIPGFLINSKAAVVRPDIYRELGLLT